MSKRMNNPEIISAFRAPLDRFIDSLAVQSDQPITGYIKAISQAEAEQLKQSLFSLIWALEIALAALDLRRREEKWPQRTWEELRGLQ